MFIAPTELQPFFAQSGANLEQRRNHSLEYRAPTERGCCGQRSGYKHLVPSGAMSTILHLQIEFAFD